MANMSPSKGAELDEPESDMSPEMLADLIEKTIIRMCANWAGELMRALSEKTPRQTIKTPAGLERVKGLLRSYEASEKQQSAEQGSREVSYEFLWCEPKFKE